MGSILDTGARIPEKYLKHISYIHVFHRSHALLFFLYICRAIFTMLLNNTMSNKSLTRPVTYELGTIFDIDYDINNINMN